MEVLVAERNREGVREGGEMKERGER